MFRIHSSNALPVLAITGLSFLLAVAVCVLFAFHFGLVFVSMLRANMSKNMSNSSACVDDLGGPEVRFGLKIGCRNQP